VVGVGGVVGWWGGWVCGGSREGPPIVSENSVVSGGES